MQKEAAPSKYLFLGLAIGIVLLSIIVLFPFLLSVVAGAILAFVFYPMYVWFTNRLKNKTISALLVAVLIIVIVAVPLGFILNHLATESQVLYYQAKQQLATGEIIETRCYENSFVCNTVNSINEFLRDPENKEFLMSQLNNVLNYVTGKVSSFVFSLPGMILQLVVILFTTYYSLKDGPQLIKRLEKFAPLKVHHQEQIIKQFGDVISALIYGSFLIALVQGALAAFGFWLFGVNAFLIWALILTFCALIPFVGAAAVWLPASLYLAISGYVQGEAEMMWKGVALFFYGMLIISTIDNILKPFIVAGRAKVHPLLVIVGILGGIAMFGLVGVILGPLILALLQKIFEIYERERSAHIGEQESDILGKYNHHGTRR